MGIEGLGSVEHVGSTAVPGLAARLIIDIMDFLRAHPETSREYEHLKRNLAASFGADVEGYTDSKTEFIRSVEARTREEMES